MFRDLQNSDKAIFLSMVKEFYSTGAVLHSVDPNNFENTFSDALNHSPLLRVLIIEEEENPIGYAILTFTYSNEAGGIVVIIDELFVSEQCRGKGCGRAFFTFIEQQYPLAKRFRLEATNENSAAIRLYQNLGYEVLDYVQLVKDRG